MDLSIIIVSWNTRDFVLSCLATVLATLETLRAEVIVVDNTSTDGSADAIRQTFPEVEVVESETNVGFAAANNLGIRISRGRYVLLLNPDTEVFGGAMARMIDFMDAHQTVAGVGPQTLNPDGTLQTSCYPFPTVSRECWRLLHLDRMRPFGIYDMSGWRRDTPRHVDVLQGSCLLLRAEALSNVGLLDEDYFIYTEEVDLCHRLRAAGWQLIWLPQAQIVHYGGSSTRHVADEMFVRLYKSKIQSFHKHHGLTKTAIYKCIIFLASVPRALLHYAGRFARPDRRERLLRIGRRHRQLIRLLPGL